MTDLLDPETTSTELGANLPDIVRPSLPELPPVPPEPAVRHWGRIGMAIVIVGLGGFIAWASVFKLAGGAYAQGMVRLSDEKQVVAHVEGGIIRKLYVKEGDQVTAGQELVVLDDYNSDTNLAILEKRRWELMARQARLEAVRDNLPDIIYPDELKQSANNEQVKEIIDAQNRQFTADRADLEGQKSILEQQTTQYDAIIASLRSQINSGATQLGLIQQEVNGVKMLLEKGLERRPRLLALQRQQEALRSQRSDFEGRIASYSQKIGEIHLQMANLEADMRSKAVASLTEVQTTLNQTNEQWLGARTRSREMTLRASQDGTVLSLRYRSEGAIVPPGQPVMNIVSSKKVFVVDARVMPMDIDVVHAGLKTQIRLSGLKQRTHVVINGEVQRISPDALIDERSGLSYFESRVTFDTADPEFKKISEADEIYAGMPADVIFIAHERTMLQYLMQPFADSFARSFHEE